MSNQLTHSPNRDNPDRPTPRSIDLLRDPARNKSTAFTEAERDALGIRGLLPARVFTQDEQLDRVIGNYRLQNTDLGRYVFLRALQDRNEKLFYRVVIDHIEEMMPIIYTPTVGLASREFANIFRRPRGLYVTAEDRGRVAEVLANWPDSEVRVIVVTDGERILGLGDLGANGMAISVGKLALYTACAGVDPSQTLPVMLDVGTNNSELREDTQYLGLNRQRLSGNEYFELVDEFVTAVQQIFPKALIQFEDFATENAYAILHKYRDRVLSFNDDIQGTAAVVLAGLMAATRITGQPLTDQTVMFLGAGSAATGIADLVVKQLVKFDIAEAEARRRLWLVDSKGLVVASRDNLPSHKLPYAHDYPAMDFVTAINELKPTALIGATGVAGAFSQSALQLMADINPRPIIFALSNPTAKAESTAEQAYRWTDGRAIFASGSPFDPVEIDGKRLVPRQGNNAYIFPGVGLGALASATTRITDDMFLAAAEALAGAVRDQSLASGSLYPSLTEIREVSVQIACAVANVAYQAGLAGDRAPNDIEEVVRSLVWHPSYDLAV